MAQLDAEFKAWIDKLIVPGTETKEEDSKGEI